MNLCCPLNLKRTWPIPDHSQIFLKPYPSTTRRPGETDLFADGLRVLESQKFCLSHHLISSHITPFAQRCNVMGSHPRSNVDTTYNQLIPAISLYHGYIGYSWIVILIYWSVQCQMKQLGQIPATALPGLFHHGLKPSGFLFPWDLKADRRPRSATGPWRNWLRVRSQLEVNNLELEKPLDRDPPQKNTNNLAIINRSTKTNKE